MIIIIDAYNFLKAIVPDKTLDQRIIGSWIAQFNQYIKKRKNDVILVFDAGPFDGISMERHGQVEVVYAGQVSSADAYIQNWITKNVGLDMLLVTSDRQIRNYADRYDVVSVSSQEFYTIFREIMHEFEQKQEHFDRSMIKTKKNQQNDGHLDELLEQATRNLVVDCDKNEYDQERSRLRNAFKQRKSDRAVRKKIEKI